MDRSVEAAGGRRRLPDLLEELAYNLRWSWQDTTAGLFEELDGALWAATRHNPVALLLRLDPERLASAERDEVYRARVAAAVDDLRAYLADDRTWYHRRASAPGRDPLVAYFSAEFGITECLSIYSGGLGVLSGDHLKSASDLGLPLVGVGLLYREGYFRQTVTADGRQEAHFPRLDVEALPIRGVERPDGTPLTVAIPFPGRQVFARVWVAQVGRIRLFLLDTDVPGNAPADQEITRRLYGGDEETRIQQELVLGVGGYRALEALEIVPDAFHMNEGHSAFLALEHVRRLMTTGGLTFNDAIEEAAARTVFTTHTPVPAGHDRFSPELMARYFGERAQGLDLSLEELMSVGREDATDPTEPFCMTVLALNLSDHRNGVSRLHGRVSRGMWSGLWPDRPVEEVPIGHITNGVHLPTWLAPEIRPLYDRYLELGSVPVERPAIPAAELWSAHREGRDRLRRVVRDRVASQLERQAVPGAEIDETLAALEQDALAVVFARRFATYKRATLILEDEARLASLLLSADRPVRLIYTGKAHPRDRFGQALIQRVVELSRDARFRGRIVFLENYDLDLARSLVQGADVWLNNPRKPKEASGTSGMKAAANGVLNVSVLDGWWDEAWELALERHASIGWAVEGGSLDSMSADALDAADADALHRIFADEVVPTFYDRDAEGVPGGWVERMEAAIRIVAPVFNTDRMVREYTERLYLPATGPERRVALQSNG